ncbi:MAG: MBL fold metallo-hydrolase [Spirulinaceae cyanobacterium]
MSEQQERFKVTFWGVRGSIPCPGAETVRYGGNTPCVEMRIGPERLIFDGGTGLRVLGQTMMSQLPIEANIFFTHTHWDHIQGFPFFIPAFVPGNHFEIYGAIAPNGATIKQRHHDQMLHPNFPVPLQIMQAKLNFNDLTIGGKNQIGEVIVENAKLNHPGEAVGYRVSWRGISVAYITDTEHFPDRLDQNVLHLARHADLLIIDSCYTDEEYHSPTTSKEGWGHSTWQECVKVAKAAEVKSLALFHHDPLHTDTFLDDVLAQVQAVFPAGRMAVEGETIEFLPVEPPPQPSSVV